MQTQHERARELLKQVVSVNRDALLEVRGILAQQSSGCGDSSFSERQFYSVREVVHAVDDLFIFREALGLYRER